MPEFPQRQAAIQLFAMLLEFLAMLLVRSKVILG
jgi:hypothetical protein